MDGIKVMLPDSLMELMTQHLHKTVFYRKYPPLYHITMRIVEQ